MLNIRDNKKNNNKSKVDFEVGLIGNPNVGKSTIFNVLTGLKQHTGNWTGKTVAYAQGYCKYKNYSIKIIDLPGTYSLNAVSEEENIANEYIINNNADCIIIVVDASNLLRNLALVLQILKITQKVVVCLNLCDEAERKGIKIDIDELSLQLGVPIVETSAIKKYGLNKLKEKILNVCSGKEKTFKVNTIQNLNINNPDQKKQIENIYALSTSINKNCANSDFVWKNSLDNKIDKLVTSKFSGSIIMLLFLCILFWITIVGANYLSDWLSIAFLHLKNCLEQLVINLDISSKISSILIDGIYTTLTWIISVMLPPMAIFFPLFSLMEDSGFLPRIAFNLDGIFYKATVSGKQSLTMSMGFGCNACGVTGCRIIGSKREKDIAIITNSFIPCNGKLPTLIAITSLFFTTTTFSIVNSLITTLIVFMLIIFTVVISLITTKLLGNTVFKGEPSPFILELPSYRKPQILKTILYSLKDRTLFILLRAITAAIPAGIIIWTMSNIYINGTTILSHCTEFLDPIGYYLGLDGVILMAFILGFPANEIVIPIILMAYTTNTTLTDYTSLSSLYEVLTMNGWTVITALCFITLCLFHYPCSTTCITIFKETKSISKTLLSIVLPTFYGVILCMLINICSSIIIN